MKNKFQVFFEKIKKSFIVNRIFLWILLAIMLIYFISPKFLSACFKYYISYSKWIILAGSPFLIFLIFEKLWHKLNPH